MQRRVKFVLLCSTLALLMLSFQSLAYVERGEVDSPVVAKTYLHSSLYIGNIYQPVTEVNGVQQTELTARINSLGVPADRALVDKRTNTFGTLIPTQPLIPGNGFGNELRWSQFGKAAAPTDMDELKSTAWSAFYNYISANQVALGVDPAEMANPGRITVHDDGRLIQIFVQRVYQGLTVRDSYITAVINSGNLVLFGTRNWAPFSLNVEPVVTPDTAKLRMTEHIAPFKVESRWGKPHLQIIPVSSGHFNTISHGQGLEHRLVWVLGTRVADDIGKWEALVDAHSGELLSFTDTVHYHSERHAKGGTPLTRKVEGGVLPVSNDGMVPDGVEQPNWPMPWADVTVGGETFFADAGGELLRCVSGEATTTLTGQYFFMNDQCGEIDESSTTMTIDLGTSGGTDCVVPPGASPGNTHASRSGFYELNRIAELARGQLPDNSWLDTRVTATMNIPQFCNATWDGSGVNFYRSGGGCANTGELAGVFDHEWGHGMDGNDTNPSISRPGEGIADIYSALRLNDSCMGRNFQGGNCGGYGDPCTQCSGVRDIDWANRQSGLPHDIAFIDSACGSGSAQPCGGSTHCEGAVYAESWWDLRTRDLPTILGMDSNTAQEVAARINFLGASPVGAWFSCVDGSGTGDGCNADGGYLNYLAADDDNGNLNDGTPHMTAIFSAFDRHGIACPTPTNQLGGCAGTPTTAPVVMATAIDRGAELSWGAVSGASSYNIYRTDGVFQCDKGKVLVGSTTDTSFTDSGLKSGREYYYTVIPMGPSDICFGPASSCTSVTAASNARATILSDTVVATTSGGDGDIAVDNCEATQVCFDINNIGVFSYNNLQLADVTCSSHDMTVFQGGTVAAANLAPCETTQVCVDLVPQGLSTGDTLTCTAELTANGGREISATFEIFNTESDFTLISSLTYDFEADAGGWTVEQGTFMRTNTGGGADGTAFYEASSANLSDQCDHIRSPILTLSASSTLEMWTNYEIEAEFTPGVWYDRANVGIYDPADGSRTLVTPSGGRGYDASGANGTCGTNGQGGWAGVNSTWASSTFDAGALGSAGIAGTPVQLDVRYGTDALEHGFGFHFDQVTLTNVSVQGADAQSDSCDLTTIFADGFESGDTSAWSNTNP